MSLTTPTTIMTLQRKVYTKAKPSCACLGLRDNEKLRVGKIDGQCDEGGSAGDSSVSMPGRSQGIEMLSVDTIWIPNV